MGYKTWLSLGAKPLPKRLNIVLTDIDQELAPGVDVAKNIDVAIAKAQAVDSEIFFIGGGMVYAQAVPIADRLYLTIVDDSPKADTYFPGYSEFIHRKKIGSGNDNGINYEFWEMTK